MSRIPAILGSSALSVLMIVGSVAALDLGQCRAVQNGAKRLECYDALAVATPHSEPAPVQPQSSGRWRIDSSRSPIDDSVNVFLLLDATSTSRPKLEGQAAPVLGFQCKEGKIDGFVRIHDFLDLESMTLQTRQDQDKAQLGIWAVAEDHHTLFSQNGKELLQQLEQKSVLTVQVNFETQDPLLLSFDVRGLSAASEPLKRACGLGARASLPAL